MNAPSSAGIRNAVQSVFQSLPEDVSWDEVHYRLFVREQIEAGLADSDAGRLIDTEEMRRRLEIQKRQKSAE